MVIAQQLHLATGLLANERDWVVERQVDEAKTRTEPSSNRALRSLPTLPELD